MRSSIASASSGSLASFTLLSAAVVATLSGAQGCTSFGSAEPPPPSEASAPTLPTDASAEAEPKAPTVTGTPVDAELTEAFGIFVVANGKADAPGTRAQPVASVQVAIDLGKRFGKRVYVCAGSFTESPTLGGRGGAALPGFPTTVGFQGGNGGFAGVSGNGTPGPSIVVVHSGPAADLRNGTTLTPGVGGAAIDERLNTVLVDYVSRIPASHAGLARTFLAL